MLTVVSCFEVGGRISDNMAGFAVRPTGFGGGSFSETGGAFALGGDEERKT